jgi:hypothetical protein
MARRIVDAILSSMPDLTAWRERMANFTDVLVPGVNHCTIGLTSRGAQKTAEVIRGLIAP